MTTRVNTRALFYDIISKEEIGFWNETASRLDNVINILD
jgi:hypothetical protein